MKSIWWLVLKREAKCDFKQEMLAMKSVSVWPVTCIIVHWWRCVTLRSPWRCMTGPSPACWQSVTCSTIQLLDGWRIKCDMTATPSTWDYCKLGLGQCHTNQYHTSCYNWHNTNIKWELTIIQWYFFRGVSKEFKIFLKTTYKSKTIVNKRW